MKFNKLTLWWIISLAFIIISISSLSSAFILSPTEVKNGNYAGTTLNSSYNELINAWYEPKFNTTQLIGDKLWIPWYSGDDVCGVANLQSGGNCNIGSVNMTVNCMVTDEFSQVFVSLSMSDNNTKFDAAYQTLISINSSYGTLPSWRVVRNGSLIYVCDSRTNSNCDSASDADANFIIGLYNAANNTMFSAGNRTKYLNYATNMSRDFVAYDLVKTEKISRYGQNISWFMASGGAAATGGLTSTDFGYNAYYSQGALAMMNACLKTGNGTYCSIANNITLNYLQAANFNLTSFTVPPGRSFKWDNLTGVINASCTNTCSPIQWDSSDAPRAYRMGSLEYYAGLINHTLPSQLVTYNQLWRERYMQSNNSAPYQFYPNGTQSANNQSGYFAQGLVSLGLMGNVSDPNGLKKFNETLRNAIGHYDSTPDSMDYAACMGVYGQSFPIAALGTAIGRDQNSYWTMSTDTTAPIVSFGDNADSGTIARTNIISNFTSTDDVSVTNITSYLYNSAFTLVNVSTSNSAHIYLNITNLAQGTYYLNGSSTDSSNNIGYSTTRTIVISIPEPAPFPTCDVQTRLGFNIILIFTALAVIVFVIGLFYREGGIFEVSVGQFTVASIAVLVSVVLFWVSAQNLGAGC